MAQPFERVKWQPAVRTTKTGMLLTPLKLRAGPLSASLALGEASMHDFKGDISPLTPSSSCALPNHLPRRSSNHQAFMSPYYCIPSPTLMNPSGNVQTATLHPCCGPFCGMRAVIAGENLGQWERKRGGKGPQAPCDDPYGLRATCGLNVGATPAVSPI